MDIAIYLILFLFFILGYMKGFLKTLLGPISLIACWAFSLFYYSQTHNIPISLAIAILGPICLHFFLSLCIKLTKKILDQEENLSIISRLAGGCISLIGKGFYLTTIIFFAAVLPYNAPNFVKFKKDLKKTKSYLLTKKYIVNNISFLSSIEKMTVAIQNPKVLEKIHKSEKFKALMNHEKIQSLYEDPAIQEAMENKNYSALMSNEKIQTILKDTELMKEFTSIINENTASPLFEKSKKYYFPTQN